MNNYINLLNHLNQQRMLDPIPSKLLKEKFPEVKDPLLAFVNLPLSLGYVLKTFKLAFTKPLI